jgi:ribokinase
MLKKPRILVVGSFMMDLIASTKKAPKSGETVIGMKFQTAPGGKGANQAVQCARLGAHVTMVGQVGDDAFGKIMTDTAQKAGVDVSHVSVDKNESSGVGHITLEVTEHGAQNRITVCPGANYTLTVEDVAWLKEEIGNYDLLMMQFELPMEVVEAVAQWAHDAGVIVMINPAPAAPISEKLLSCATYLSPNEHEAAAIAGHELRADENGVNMDDVQAVAGAFQAKGVENLIITLGENGSIVAGKNGVHQTACVRMPHVADPTAAGDSFVAAFCTGLCAGLPQGEALAFASHAAAITVSRMGAMPSLPTVSEVQALLVERGYTGFDPKSLDALK